MRSIFRHFRRFAPELIALSMVLVALTLAIRTTSDLSWPPKDDFHREMGSTQSVLDGRPLADPGYLGEGRWYSPLLPRLVAIIAPHFGLPLPTLYTRAGPYFNLLVPVAFYVFVGVLFGRWAAVAGLAVFLFSVGPFVPPRNLGTYSPWLWARNFAQGLFFLAAAATLVAFRSGKPRWAVLAGILLGLTFLTHAAPAIILVLFALMLWALLLPLPGRPADSSWQRASTTLIIIAGTSFAVSFQLLLQLFLDYGFQVKNSAPSRLVGIYGRQIVLGMLSIRTALAIVGGIVLVRRYASLQVGPLARNGLLLLLAATIAPLGYGYLVRQAAYRGIELVQLVPEFHFHIYFTGLQAAFAGVALCYLARRLGPGLARLLRASRLYPRPMTDVAGERLALATLLVIVIGAGTGSYLSSPDLRQFREDSLERARDLEVTQLYDWVLHNAEGDDVFLAAPLLGFYSISAAARKVVVLPEVYSNPFVDYGRRKRDANEMYQHLRRGEVASFLALASTYQVKYVVAAEGAPDWCRLGEIDHPKLRVAAELGSLTVYGVSY